MSRDGLTHHRRPILVTRGRASADSCAYCMHYKNSTSNGWSSRAIVDASFGHTSNTPEVHSALNRSNWMCAWGRPAATFTVIY